MANVTKKLINQIDGCVDDLLEGFVMVHPGLRQLPGPQGKRILVRHDLLEYSRSGKVVLITGGGSGHEPGIPGSVGAGMLSVAVLGAVFAAPPPALMLQAIRTAHTGSQGGILLIYNNYTGDRINFGLAVERAQAEGIRVEQFIFSDDCAAIPSQRMGDRRGLAGETFMFKIAGAMAEEGKSIEEIMAMLEQASKATGTLGICLQACSVPGSGPLFTIDPEMMEIGLGLHGEAGVMSVKMKSARETVEMMLDHMTSPSNQYSIRLKAGDRVALLLNNLGSTTEMEMYILAKEIITNLESRDVCVDRVYQGRILTSEDMVGMSISIMRIDNHIKHYLDAFTSAACWPKPCNSQDIHDRVNPQPLDVETDCAPRPDSAGTSRFEGMAVSQATGQLIRACLMNVCQKLIASESLLNQLDAGSGDGDCGSTLCSGAREFQKRLEVGDDLCCHPYDLLMALSTITENTMGGSSGGLYSLLLTAAGITLKSTVDLESWVDALGAGMKSISRYGGAQPGDRTMLDSLHAAHTTLELCKTDLATAPRQVFLDAVKAAEKRAEETTQMEARAGRARCVSKDRLSQPDPGAQAVAIWLRAIYEPLMNCN